MRSAALWLIVGAIVVGVAHSVPAADSPSLVRTTFQVQGMHCDGCSATIIGTLERTDGVVSATADHEGGVAEAVYRPTEVEAEDLKAAIEKLGYSVTSMQTEPVES
jgi:copper chaperone CopZ